MRRQKDPKIIIEKFLSYFLEVHKKEEIIVRGVILFGSYSNEKMISKNSDLDLYLVIDNIKKRFRGVAKIDSVEVDYFVNPYDQLVYDLDQSKKISKKTVIHMLAEGKILKDYKNKLLSLKKKSIKLLANEKLEKMSDFTIINMKYFINDYLNDIQDSYEEKDLFAWQLNINSLLNYLVEVFCKKKGILLVKPKYQKKQIQKKYPKFINMYEVIVGSNSKKIKMDNIKKLSNYVIDNLGGQLPENWEIESKVITTN